MHQHIRWWFAAALLLGSLPLHAQPAFFEPPAGYYKARGAKVSVVWSVDRTTLTEEESLTATLTVEGASNPQEVIRPDLAKIPDYANRFRIEYVSSPGNAKNPTFVYLLRPRNAEVNRLPTLEFWYDSGVKFGDPFKKTTAKGKDLVVTKVVKPKPAAMPLIASDRLFAIETGSAVLEREPFATGPIRWSLLFLLGVLTAIAWYFVWRRMYPDGARLAKLRRNRALRRATDAIRRANRSSDPAGAVAAAVLGYLRSRFPLPAGAETPGEVEAALRSAGPAEAEAAASFLRRCDEVRFSSASDNPLSLVEEARSLLGRLEAVA